MFTSIHDKFFTRSTKYSQFVQKGVCDHFLPLIKQGLCIGNSNVSPKWAQYLGQIYFWVCVIFQTLWAQYFSENIEVWDAGTSKTKTRAISTLLISLVSASSFSLTPPQFELKVRVLYVSFPFLFLVHAQRGLIPLLTTTQLGGTQKHATKIQPFWRQFHPHHR